MTANDRLARAVEILRAEGRLETILDALNVRALDRQADEYGDADADAAADLYCELTGKDPDEAHADTRAAA